MNSKLIQRSVRPKDVVQTEKRFTAANGGAIQMADVVITCEKFPAKLDELVSGSPPAEECPGFTIAGEATFNMRDETDRKVIEALASTLNGLIVGFEVIDD